MEHQCQYCVYNKNFFYFITVREPLLLCLYMMVAIILHKIWQVQQASFYFFRFFQPHGHLGWSSTRDWSVWGFPHHRLAAGHCQGPHATPPHHQKETRRHLGEDKERPWCLVWVGVCATSGRGSRYIPVYLHVYQYQYSYCSVMFYTLYR